MRTCAAFLFLVGILVAAPGQSRAQADQTLADIRQELTVLYVEMQRLKRELSTTQPPATTIAGDTVLQRVGSLETALQALTARTEALEYRIDRIVRDGTTRIGDLEFRLVELEGGDLSQLGTGTTLGGEPATSEPVPEAAVPAPAIGTTSELAVAEEADFQTAVAAHEAGDFARAASLLDGFNQTYPGSPLAADAALRRGQALDALGDTRQAARAFLESYSLAPDGPVASTAVLELGTALGRLGKRREACVTLGEVGVRYPGSQAVAEARAEMAALECE